MKKGTILAQTPEGDWLRFRNPVKVLCAKDPSEVLDVLFDVDRAVSEGKHAAGFVAYEAAAAFDPALVTYPPDDFPLAWFGVYETPERLGELPDPDGDCPATLDWQADMDRASYGEAIQKIHRWIREGDTYQVNFTMRLRSQYTGDPYALFARLCKAQAARYAVFGDIGDYAICSASPELFFEKTSRDLVAKPMKGTAARGLTDDQDDAIAAELSACTKNRAENVMIVDMIRNDLGRIAEPASIVPHPLFEVERYPTLFQMVSTVRAKSRASLADMIGALFPCASITGAPKVRTMQIIHELEKSPRHFYTGMAGYCLADGHAQFNVMIRTVTVDKKAQMAEYGVGGGIVWDSVEQNEYEECLTKAAVLTHVPPTFSLLETLRYDPDEGFAYLTEHCERASASARYFGYPFDQDAMLDQLHNAVSGKGNPQRVRWLLAPDGAMSVESMDLKPLPDKPVGLASVGSCDKQDVFLYHKTTHRVVYEKALAQFPDCGDVILVNADGDVTESCLANVVFERDGRKYTPPLVCGLLDGTLRRALLRAGALREAILTRDQLLQCERIWLINSVRGWIEVPREHLVTDL